MYFQIKLIIDLQKDTFKVKTLIINQFLLPCFVVMTMQKYKLC